MSEDKIQRQIDFIIQQQAKFAEHQARSAERQAEFDKQIDKLNEQNVKFREDMVMLKDVVLSLANIVDRHDQEIAALIEQGKETDERLNNLITVVERSIADRGNGRKS